MAFEKFDIFFSGKILPQHDPAKVRHAVAQLFKLDQAKLAQLFSGTRLCIKRDVDAETSAQLRFGLTEEREVQAGHHAVGLRAFEPGALARQLVFVEDKAAVLQADLVVTSPMEEPTPDPG